MQLWSPLAHSVGVARTFAELDSLAYASLFPDSLARLRQNCVHMQNSDDFIGRTPFSSGWSRGQPAPLPVRAPVVLCFCAFRLLYPSC